MLWPKHLAYIRHYMPIVTDESLKYLRKRDKVIDMIYKKYGASPNWERPQGYETLVMIILEQQVSLSSAQAAYEKLKSLVGKITPSRLLKESVPSLREATVSRQKAGYIIGLAKDIKDKTIDLKRLPDVDRATQLEILTSIKGIGPWTAEVYLLFALQDQDVYPRGDIALINTIKELYGASSSAEAEEISHSWSPYRSTASFMLWHYYLRKRGRENIIQV